MKPDMATLAASITGNRFLPVPPPELHCVGDGDFRAIGAEFLRHFVEIGGLEPTHRVLDIGCGVGRMALPLTQYLDPASGSYEGIDIVLPAIDWCEQTLASVYGNFHFHHLDARHHLYNPAGALTDPDVDLPFPDGDFDFVFLTSVLTHLRVEETIAYVREIGRLLRPGGRCFLSLFLMTEGARAALREEQSRLSFDPAAEGPEYLADSENPGAAVAYDEAFLVDAMAEAGLRPATFVYGHWSGLPGTSFQDLCLFIKTTEPRS